MQVLPRPGLFTILLMAVFASLVTSESWAADWYRGKVTAIGVAGDTDRNTRLADGAFYIEFGAGATPGNPSSPALDCGPDNRVYFDPEHIVGSFAAMGESGVERNFLVALTAAINDNDISVVLSTNPVDNAEFCFVAGYYHTRLDN